MKHLASRWPLAAFVSSMAIAVACAVTGGGSDVPTNNPGSGGAPASGIGGSSTPSGSGGTVSATGGAPAAGTGGTPSTPAGTGGVSSTPAGDAGGTNMPPSPPSAGADSWTQAAGPQGTWRVAVAGAPTRWSVAAKENILWRAPLPNEGQGGIAVFGDSLFLATFPPFSGGKSSTTVMGHALDRATGAIKWSVKLEGNAKASPIAYQYSDATSWTPVTDGKSICFFNAAGEMGCWDFTGKELWRRSFPGQPDQYPFNRQHEPILHGDTIVTLSPLGAGDPPGGQGGWNYLHGIDIATGKTKWIAEAASTFYNTAVMGKLPDGRPAILHGRGGPHGVPERPVGLTMTSLAPGSEGKTIWQYEGQGTALYTMTWDEKYAYWFTTAPNEAQIVIDVATGKPLRTQSLYEKADVRMWNAGKGGHDLAAGVNVRTLTDATYGGSKMHVMPNWHTNIAAGGYHWFLTSTNNNRSGSAGGHSGPPHCVGRVNVETGKVEYLELPVGVERAAGAPEKLIYGKSLRTAVNDSKGNDIAGEDRSRTDGWEIPAFWPSPLALGNKIYFSTTLGLTYVFDAGAATLDEKALLGIGDLGPNGQTWSLAGPSFVGGVLYHHSSKELVAIGAATP